MSQLGADLYSHIEEENGVKKLEIEKHGSAGLEGRLLLTLCLNYRLANLWRTKRIILVLILAYSFIEAFCQKESKDYIYKGLVRTTLTFATGFMPKQKLNNLYLTGNIEYYSDSKISFRGDGMYFFNSMNQDKTLKQNHSLNGGAAYHFPNKNFDPFVGLQTGLAISQLGSLYQDSPKTEIANNPLISRIVVFNFYAQKWFHLFVNAKYNFGKHLASDAIMSLNELSFSFGLGFNIN